MYEKKQQHNFTCNGEDANQIIHIYVHPQEIVRQRNFTFVPFLLCSTSIPETIAHSFFSRTAFIFEHFFSN